MRRRAAFRSRAAFVSLALAVLAVAGCGGGTKTVTSTPLPPGVNLAPTTPKAVNAIFHAVLTGRRLKPFVGAPALKKGAPNASAVAVATTRASTNEFCWEFSQLKNVPSPTVARLFRNFEGATGRGGFNLGRRYTPSGCIHLEAPVLGLIDEKPGQFYLNIHSAQHPFGAVRGPLTLG